MVNEVDVIPQKKEKTVSYSQYSDWSKCPRSWKLGYIDKLKKYENSINTAFGTAIHKALQLYLDTLYSKSALEADDLKLFPVFEEEFRKCLKKPDGQKKKDYAESLGKTVEELEKELHVFDISSDVEYISNEEDISGFMEDGNEILKHFVRSDIRTKYFPSKKYEIIGIEFPLVFNVRPNLKYKGFVDLILQDKITKKYLIYDIKTSTNGWNKYQKQDNVKLNQLLLYKKIFSKLMKVPEKDVSVEFFIIKRKLFENVDYVQSRIQSVIPPSATYAMNNAVKSFMEFINVGFDKEGNHNKNGKFPKTPGKAKKNCKYCSFKGTEHCDGKASKEDE